MRAPPLHAFRYAKEYCSTRRMDYMKKSFYAVLMFIYSLPGISANFSGSSDDYGDYAKYYITRACGEQRTTEECARKERDIACQENLLAAKYRAIAFCLEAGYREESCLRAQGESKLVFKGESKPGAKKSVSEDSNSSALEFPRCRAQYSLEVKDEEKLGQRIYAREGLLWSKNEQNVLASAEEQCLDMCAKEHGDSCRRKVTWSASSKATAPDGSIIFNAYAVCEKR